MGSDELLFIKCCWLLYGLALMRLAPNQVLDIEAWKLLFSKTWLVANQTCLDEELLQLTVLFSWCIPNIVPYSLATHKKFLLNIWIWFFSHFKSFYDQSMIEKVRVQAPWILFWTSIPHIMTVIRRLNNWILTGFQFSYLQCENYKDRKPSIQGRKKFVSLRNFLFTLIFLQHPGSRV